jgi:iron complex outermembrane recepter protein
MTSRNAFLSVFSAATVLAVGAQAASAADAPGASLDVEEVVVTARKRAEDILKTPVSVAAITSEDIEARGIVSLNDVANSTPSLNISNVNSGRSDRSFQQITLRGFTPSTVSSTLTATFIDGVPVASASALNNITDPARIEILKGPQSAYFGRNTFAGAVNVVNKEPGKNYGGSLSVLGGTRSNLDVTGTFEGPLVSDAVSFRVTGRMYSKDGSWKNNANPGQTLGDQETRSFSLFLSAQPTDNFSAKLYGLYSQDDDGPSAQGQLSAWEVRANNGVTNIPRLSGSSAGTLVLPSLSNCDLTGYTNGRASTEARVVRPFICGAAPGLPAGFSPAQNTNVDSLISASLANPAFRVVSPSQGVDGYGLVRTYQHAHLNLDYEFGDSGFTLSSLTGINDEFYSELADLDNYNSSALLNPANPGGTNASRRTTWDFPFLVERETRDFSQEFRLTYDGDGPLSGVIGASYLKAKSIGDLVSVQGEIVNGTPRAFNSTTQPPTKAETTGVFFGVNYKVTDKLKVSAEGRSQSDKIYGYTGGANLTISPTNQFGLTPGTYAPLSVLIKKDFKNFLPRVIVQYDFDQDMMAYASWSKGVNVGLASFNTGFLGFSSTILAAVAGLNLGIVVQPEKLTNYEVGLKGKFLDGKLRAQLAIYTADWTDQLNQRSILVQDAPVSQGGTGNIQIVSGVANSGETKVQGIEVDLVAAPIDGLEINFAAAMNESDIRSFADPNVSLLTGVIGDGFKGHQLPLASKYSANFGIQYGGKTDLVEDGSWFVRGDLSWKDKQYLDPANITWIKARSVVNLRAGIARGPLSIDAFVLNAFNDKNYTSIAQNAPLVPTFAISSVFGYLNVGLPELRTYGVKVGYKF